MKTAEEKTPAITTRYTTPFFERKGSQHFFGPGTKPDSFFQKSSVSPIVQPKLTIGQPNDPYEKEADAVAQNVVSSSTPVLQTKCAECEEEEKLQKQSLSEEEKLQMQPLEEDEEILQTQPAEEEEELQMKPSLRLKDDSHPGRTEVGPRVQNKISNSRGSGQPLDSRTRSFMESRMQSDFSSVNLHTDGEAVQMNRELGARAFTVGSDIYFNKGEYRPETTQGKKLLAHELTHTVQQSGNSRIQRAVDPEFKVGGKFEGAASDSDSIYFDYSSSAIDTDEEAKITALAASTTQDYELIGFSSEEGGDAGNRRMARARINAVDRKMAAKGHTGRRDKKNQFGRGANKLDYRRLRRVDILSAGAPSSEPDCSAGPVASCGTTFTDAFPIAVGQVAMAHIQMISAPLIPAEKVRIENAVAAMFGDASHFDTVRTHLGNLLSQVADQPNTVRCHNSCDSTCQQASAYMDGNTGPGAVLTLCPPFYSNNNPSVNAETLIHEALHATSGLATQDLAYSSERGITFLDSATALKNTDSYVLFIQELNNPGSVLGGGGGSRDIIDPAITGTELGDLRRVMAYLEKWVIESTAETSSLYDIIVEVIGAGTWSGVSYPYYQDTMSFLAPLFGLTVPAAVPDESDQVAVAGIYDRLMRMDNLLWGTDIEIKKDPGTVRFTPGPAEPLMVNDAFLTSGQNAMVYTLLAKIVEANTAISTSHKGKYVTLVEEIRKHAGHAAPAP